MAGDGPPAGLRRTTATGRAEPAALDDLHAAFAELAIEAPLLAQDLVLLETAAVEVLANVIEHGRPHGQVNWEFEVTIESHRIRAVLVDSAAQWDPPPRPVMPDPLAESGRGLALVHALVDLFDHTGLPDGNRWVLERRTGHRA